MNKLIISGNLTADPVAAATSTGKTVTNFTVAVNEGYGESQRTTFFRVSAWEKRGEVCKQYLRKGSKVLVVGTVQARAYNSQTGEIRASLDVTANEIEFLSSRADDAAHTEPAAQNSNRDEQTGMSIVENDDLPF